MALAITDDHRALAEVVRSFLADRKALALSRSLLESEGEPLPPFWDEFAAQGWLRLHVPEAYGGEGFGLPELAVVLEETGRVVAPGPILPTVTASAVLAAVPEVDTDAEISPLLADLASGSLVGAVGVGGSLTRAADGTVSGDAEVVLGAGSADILLLAVGDDLGIFDAASTERYSCDVLDPTCRSAAVTVDAANPRAFLPGGRRLAAYHVRVLAAAQAAGIAVACREHAVDYVKAREQFGRPIGMFQAVKHHCADL